jgi:hypothetical protein
VDLCLLVLDSFHFHSENGRTLEFSRAEHKAFKQTEAKEFERLAVEASRWNDLFDGALRLSTPFIKSY